MSAGVQTLASSGFVPTPPLGSLNLSSAQEAQIEQILGELQGGVLTPAQAQARIGAIVNGLPSSTGKAPSIPGTPGQAPLPTLHLSSQQRTQIEAIFKSAQASGTSADGVRAQVNSVLTPGQRQQLEFLSSYSSRGSATSPSPSYVVYANA